MVKAKGAEKPVELVSVYTLCFETPSQSQILVVSSFDKQGNKFATYPWQRTLHCLLSQLLTTHNRAIFTCPCWPVNQLVKAAHKDQHFYCHSFEKRTTNAAPSAEALQLKLIVALVEDVNVLGLTKIYEYLAVLWLLSISLALTFWSAQRAGELWTQTRLMHTKSSRCVASCSWP